MSSDAHASESAAARPPLRPRGSNQMGMAQFNERVVLQAIRLHGALPQAQIARLTHLTAQTVSLILARLESAGLLLRLAPVRGKVGQPSVPIALDPEGAFSIGINVGRRSLDVLLIDFQGDVLRITQQELAYLVGLSRQRVNEALVHLAAQGLIRVEYGGLRVLDLAGLRATVAGGGKRSD